MPSGDATPARHALDEIAAFTGFTICSFGCNRLSNKFPTQSFVPVIVPPFRSGAPREISRPLRQQERRRGAFGMRSTSTTSVESFRRD